MTEIFELVESELAQPVAPRVAALAEALAGQYGDASAGVLFYGSCLRSGALDGQMLDFYLIVKSYEQAYGRSWLARANRLLPPNVFYFEACGLSAKYAVLSIEDLHRLAGPATRSVSVWARFAQPSALVWSADEACSRSIVAAVAQSAPTLMSAARPMLPDRISVRDLWTSAFALTYEAELRSERQGRGVAIFDTDPARYSAFTGPSLNAAGLEAEISADGEVRFLEGADRRSGDRSWRARRVQGKLLSAARLLKAAFTFDGGIDYLAWKIERHSGVSIRIAPWHRKHPILAGLLLLPHLRRKGAIR